MQWCHSVLQDTVTSLPVVVTGATNCCSDIRLLFFKGKQIDKETDFNTSPKKPPQVSFNSVWRRPALIGWLCPSFDWRVSQVKFLLKFRISSFSSCPEHNIEHLEWAGHQLFLFFSFSNHLVFVAIWFRCRAANQISQMESCDFCSQTHLSTHLSVCLLE